MNKNKNKQLPVQTKTRINYRVLTTALLVLSVTAIAVFFWHHYSRSVLSDSLLQQARHSITLAANVERDSDVEQLQKSAIESVKAIRQLQDYLKIHPENMEARALLARAFDVSPLSLSDPQQNLEFHLNALAVEQSRRAPLLLRTAELLSAQGRHSEARKLSKELVLRHDLSSDPDLRAKAYRQLALDVCEQMQMANDPARTVERMIGDRLVGESVEEAVRLNPADARILCYLAAMYRESGQREFLSERQLSAAGSLPGNSEWQQFADQMVSDMVARNPDDVDTLLASHLYKRHYGIDGANEDLIEAVRIGPDNPQVSFLFGSLMHDEAATESGSSTGIDAEIAVDPAIREKLENAREHLRNTVQLAPFLPEAHARLGEVYLRLGERGDALDAWREGIASSTRTELTGFQPLIAELLRSDDTGEIQEATSLLTEMNNRISQLARDALVDPVALHQWSESRDFLTAVSEFRNGRTAKAVQMLQQLAARTDSRSRIPEHARRLLVEINREHGRTGDVAAYLESLNELAANETAGLKTVGDEYLAAGDFTKAGSVFWRLAHETNTVDAWVRVVECLYRQQSNLAAPDRNWNEFNLAVERARTIARESGVPDSGWQTEFFDAMRLIQQTVDPSEQNLKPILQRLAQLADYSPNVSRRLSLIYNELGNLEEADRWYTKFVSIDGPGFVDHAILKSELLTGRGELDNALELLESTIARTDAIESGPNETFVSTAFDPATFDPATFDGTTFDAATFDAAQARFDLVRSRIHVQLAQGENVAALAYLQQQVGQRPDDARLLFELAELSIRLKIPGPVAEPWEQSLARFEPEDGRYRKTIDAVRLLNDALKTSDQAHRMLLLKEADRIRQQVAGQASRWPLLNVVGGDVCFAIFENSKEGSRQKSEYHDKAAFYYQQAVISGEQETRILLRLGMLEPDPLIARKWMAMDPRTNAVLLLQTTDVPHSERIRNLQHAFRLLQKQIVPAKGPQATDLILIGQVSSELAKVIRNEEQKTHWLAVATENFDHASQADDVELSQLFVMGTFYIERESFDQARTVIERIDALVAGDCQLSPLALALRVKLIEAGDPENGIAEINGQVNAAILQMENDTQLNTEARGQWNIAVARICDGAGLNDLAVSCYRKAAEVYPEISFELSSSLLRAEKYEESMQLLGAIYESVPVSLRPDIVAAMANVLTTAHSESAATGRMQKIQSIAAPALSVAHDDFPRDVRVLTSLANISLIVDENSDRAVGLYREAKIFEPKNVLVLNNLATILSEEPSTLNEALATIDYALEVAGNNPQLLDTKAVILCRQDRLDESEKILVNIVDSEADVRYRWHLAEVYWRKFESTNDQTQLQLSISNLQLAIDSGLDLTVLTRGERSRLNELKTQLAGLQ